MYPLRRNRRLRTNDTIRGLVRETIISPNDFLVPLFVVEGNGIKEEVLLTERPIELTYHIIFYIGNIHLQLRQNDQGCHQWSVVKN